MNILHTVKWENPTTETDPRAFYEQLRKSVAKGKTFPMKCPYEVALVHVLPPNESWMVAVLALPNSAGDDSLAIVNRLQEWFAACGATGGADRETRSARSLSVKSELGYGYDVIESFGTFVGEPEAETVPPKETVKTATKAVTTESIPADTLDAKITALLTPARAETAPHQTPEPVRAATSIPKPPTYTLPVSAQPPSGKRSACIGWGVVGVGGFLTLGGLLVALLFVVLQYTAVDPSDDVDGFVAALACIPLPIFLAGLLVLALGAFLVYVMKKKSA